MSSIKKVTSRKCARVKRPEQVNNAFCSRYNKQGGQNRATVAVTWILMLRYGRVKHLQGDWLYLRTEGNTPNLRYFRVFLALSLHYGRSTSWPLFSGGVTTRRGPLERRFAVSGGGGGAGYCCVIDVKW